MRRTRAVVITAVASVALLTPHVVYAAPSEEDIARAQAEEEAAKMSVAQIEVRLASVTAQANEALQAAQIAAEELNAANIALDEATATADQAQKDADQAQADFEQGRREIASVAQTAYREGASSLDSIAPYLGSNGLRTVETKQNSIETFSASADARMQRVVALEQVASVMQKAADQALENQTMATAEVEVKTRAAESAAQSALSLQQSTEIQREALVAELARKTSTTVELINEREAALEAERLAAAEAAARAAAEEAARQEAARLEAERQAEAARQQAAVVVPQTSYTPPASRTEWRDDSVASSGGASTAIAAAKSYLGVPYVWGGESYGGVDCSGLTMLAYRQAGVYLPHYSKSQYNYGTKVSFNSAEPGDLIFWSTNGSQSGIYHVAIYLGGSQMIEAPSPGSSVRITSIWGWSQLMPYAVRL